MQAYSYPLQLSYSTVDHYLYRTVETGKAEVAGASLNISHLKEMVAASVPDMEDIVGVFVPDVEDEPIFHKFVEA